MSNLVSHLDVIYSDDSVRHFDQRFYKQGFSQAAAHNVVGRHLQFGRDNPYANPKVESTRRVMGPVPVKYRFWVAVEEMVECPPEFTYQEVKPEHFRKW